MSFTLSYEVPHSKRSASDVTRPGQVAEADKRFGKSASDAGLFVLTRADTPEHLLPIGNSLDAAIEVSMAHGASPNDLALGLGSACGRLIAQFPEHRGALLHTLAMVAAGMKNAPAQDSSNEDDDEED
jgi:hypothetical protein